MAFSPKRVLSTFFSTIFLFHFCISTDTITPIQTIRDGDQLISSGQSFVFGFFSPGNSKNRYVGVWYNKIPKKAIVWVANRENPVTDSSGILTIKGGNLALVQGRLNNITIWSTNISTVSNYSTALLMDSGNLVLRDDQRRVLWEGFDYPTHTQLPGMKLGLDRRTGLNRILTSWKSLDDPARGDFSFRLGPEGLPEFILMEGPATIWRTGPWNGLTWSGEPGVDLGFGSHYHYSYVANKDEVSVSYNLYNTTTLMRVVLDVSGDLQALAWTNMSRRWSLFWEAPADICDRHGKCGPYGICDRDRVSRECSCLRGFEPKTPGGWSMKDRSDGCVRSRPLDCRGKTDGFLRLARVKLPDTSEARVEPGLSLKACEEECLKNCSCTAYASLNINGGGDGCVMWDGDLIDLKVFTDGGQDLFTRVAASELDNGSKDFRRTRNIVITISTIILVVLALISISYCRWRNVKGRNVKARKDIYFDEMDFEENENGLELPLFDLSDIMTATNNFSEANMLGMGGFGPVYKGKLQNGREIAVKRLSKNSGQGTKEFKNEVTLISKLQHKNLVRIIGCCIFGEEKILIYEYMQNKSLDCFIFDQKRAVMLDWRKRFNIIMGIARGVLYLHEDSRLKIIHRDLKLSNVLLDDEMNPKISDFGMARIFGESQTHENTSRVVGTYGYMSPEYAMNGLFSVKSDVFSFGVILLEIITGRKNNNYSSDYSSMSLIGHAWKLWKGGGVLELVDSSLGDYSCESEVLRCIQVGLLCVQESAEDRPNMSDAVFMLSNETTMPSPTQPAFCLPKGINQTKRSTNETGSSSANELTITEVEAR